MTTCPVCRQPYGRSYEAHTGARIHQDAVRLAVGRPVPEWRRRALEQAQGHLVAVKEVR